MGKVSVLVGLVVKARSACPGFLLVKLSESKKESTLLGVAPLPPSSSVLSMLSRRDLRLEEGFPDPDR